jgi:WD40 repeat protein
MITLADKLCAHESLRDRILPREIARAEAGRQRTSSFFQPLAPSRPSHSPTLIPAPAAHGAAVAEKISLRLSGPSMASNAFGHYYSTFISYRHADNREEGRRWADWLHQLLETYEVPQELVGQPNGRGELIPHNLYPVFRDELELPADAELSLPIQKALENSASLIVICSPRAVESYYVSQEIRIYKESGKAHRVLALIVDGEPNADDPEKLATGIDPAAECLPQPLRYGVPNAEGVLDWSQPAKPPVADVRPEGRPEQGWTQASFYGAALRKAARHGATDRLRRGQRDYADRLRLAGLQMIAEVLGIHLDQLTRHDKDYQAQKFRRWAYTVGSVVGFILIAGTIALWQWSLAAKRGAETKVAAAKRLETQHASSFRDYSAAQASFAKGEWRRGLAFLGRALKSNPENSAAAFTFWQQVVYGQGDRDSLPVLILVHPGAVSKAVFNPSGSLILTACAKDAARVFDARSGSEIRQLKHPGGVLDAIFDRGGAQALTAGTDRTVRLWNSRTGVAIGQPFLCRFDLKSLALNRDKSRVLLWTTGAPVILEYPALKELPLTEAPNAGPWPKKQFTALIFNPDSKVFAAVRRNGVYFGDAESGAWKFPLVNKFGGEVTGADFSGDGRFLLQVSAKSKRATNGVGPPSPGDVEIFTTEEPQLIAPSEPSPPTLGPKFRRNARPVAIPRSPFSSVRGWGEPTVFEARVNSAVFSPDGTEMLAACADGVAILWRKSTNGASWQPAPEAALLRLAHPASLSSVAFRPDGWQFLTVCDDRIVRVWDTFTGELINSYQHPARVDSAVFSADGARVLTVAEDNTVRVWETAGRPEGEFRPALAPPPNLEESPDGEKSLMLAGSTVRLLDKRTGDPVGAPLVDQSRSKLTNAGFSSDGTTVFTVNSDRKVRLWQTPRTEPPDPDQISQAAIVLSGLRFTDYDTLEAVGMDERMSLASQWRVLPAKPTFWGKLMHWSLNRDALQPFTPASTVSRRQMADALLSSNLRDEASILDPTNPNLPKFNDYGLRRHEPPKKAPTFLTAGNTQAPIQITPRRGSSYRINDGPIPVPRPVRVAGSNLGQWLTLGVDDKNIRGWKITGKSIVNASGDVLTLKTDGGLAGIVSEFGDFTGRNLHGMRFELAASQDASAWVAIRAEEHSGGWVGYTSHIFAEGGNILAGRAGIDFATDAIKDVPLPTIKGLVNPVMRGFLEKAVARAPVRSSSEEGFERQSVPPGQFFVIEFELHDNGSHWVSVNGVPTSGLLMNGDSLHGHIGLFVESGTLSVRKVEIRN